MSAILSDFLRLKAVSGGSDTLSSVLGNFLLFSDVAVSSSKWLFYVVSCFKLLVIIQGFVNYLLYQQLALERGQQNL